jgi:hypothetical protein
VIVKTIKEININIKESKEIHSGKMLKTKFYLGRKDINHLRKSMALNSKIKFENTQLRILKNPLRIICGTEKAVERIKGNDEDN